jgi:hypothetical protein
VARREALGEGGGVWQTKPRPAVRRLSSARRSREKRQAASSRHGDRRERVRSTPAGAANRERQPGVDAASPRVSSRSVRGPESGGLVRGGAVAAEALSYHLAQARRKETPSPSLLRALSDNNVFRRRCRSRAQRRRLLHHEPDNVLLVDVRASVWLAGRDVCPVAATDPRQAGSAPAI